jgi:RNA polymerase sigma factor (sigma-70 family)
MLRLNLLNDKTLIRRIQENDRTVLGDVYAKFRKMVISHIKNHGGSNEEAEDIYQESIIVFWQNVSSGKFELTAKISTYLVAVAKNKWMVELRKRKFNITEDPPENTQNDDPLILDEMIENEDSEKIRTALDQIQPVCKKLLILFYFEERSMKEIAQILQFANPNVAKSKKYQCKDALKKMLLKNVEKERRI